MSAMVVLGCQLQIDSAEIAFGSFIFDAKIGQSSIPAVHDRKALLVGDLLPAAGIFQSARILLLRELSVRVQPA